MLHTQLSGGTSERTKRGRVPDGQSRTENTFRVRNREEVQIAKAQANTEPRRRQKEPKEGLKLTSQRKIWLCSTELLWKETKIKC